MPETGRTRGIALLRARTVPHLGPTSAWRAAFRRCHGPTWLVAAAIYGAWTTLTILHDRLPLPLLVLLGGIVTAWHGSLQHETIHGHPGGSRIARWLIGAPPLSLWLPYEVYRETHQRHHATEHLTDPSHDPESAYRTRDEWSRIGPVRRALALASRTVAGRLVLEPLVMIARFLGAEAMELRRRTEGRGRAWFIHGFTVLLVVAWLAEVAHLPLWKYVLAFVYPGASLTLLRSFAEHRPDRERDRRTTIVEADVFFRLLFLNNNLHVIHHRSPHLPWFELPRAWANERTTFIGQHPDLVHAGYWRLLARHAVRPISPPELP